MRKNLNTIYRRTYGHLKIKNQKKEATTTLSVGRTPSHVNTILTPLHYVYVAAHGFEDAAIMKKQKMENDSDGE